MQQIHRLHHKEEEKWRLKSRNIWLRIGDKNTKFFHKQEKTREMKNNIKKIYNIEGQLLKVFGEIKHEAYKHFQDHFTE